MAELVVSRAERLDFCSGLDVNLWVLQVWTELRPGLVLDTGGAQQHGWGGDSETESCKYPPPPKGEAQHAAITDKSIKHLASRKLLSTVLVLLDQTDFGGSEEERW